MEAEAHTPAPHPLGLCRSALFAAAERSAEGALQSREIASYGSTQLRYRGPGLTQRHALVWQAVMVAFQENNAEDKVQISQADLLRLIGRKTVDTIGRRALWGWLQDLQSGLLDLRTQRHRVSTPLLGPVVRDEHTGELTISIPDATRVLVSDEVALIDLDWKARLARNQLASWLYDFVSSQQKGGYPFPVDELRRLSGSTLALAQFRQRLRKAADALTDAGLLVSWTINRNDRFVFEKVGTRVLLKKPDAARKTLADHAHAARADDALARRGQVAL